MANNNSKIKTFVPTETIIPSKKGRTNFADGSETFKEHMRKIVNALAQKVDIYNEYTDLLTAAQNELINYTKSKTRNLSVYDSLQSKIEELSTKKNEAMKEVQSHYPELNGADKNLYSAYYHYQTTGDSANLDLYKRAFIEWFYSWGMIMGSDDFGFFSTKLGVRNVGLSGIYKNGGKNLFQPLSEKQFCETLYRIIADLMIKKGLLNALTFNYTPIERVERQRAVDVKTSAPITPEDSIIKSDLAKKLDKFSSMTKAELRTELDKACVKYNKTAKHDDLIKLCVDNIAA